MGLLDGKVAVVTGSGRGIGAAIARCLASEGAKVVINDVGVSLDGRGTEDDTAVMVCKEIAEAGGEAVPNYDSVADFDGAASIIGAAVESFGTIDILVNNAGIVRDRTLVKMDESDFDAVVGVHMKGTFNCARHAAPIMKEQGYGRIVNITSSAGLRGNFGQTNYGAAKAAIMGMTFVWALELGRSGITVNAVAPAGATRMTASLYEKAGTEPSPLQDPALNAPLIAYLASERAAHVNGQILGRTDYAYTLFQHPKQVAWMWREGGWTPSEVADGFDSLLGQHLQEVGMVMPTEMAKSRAGSLSWRVGVWASSTSSTPPRRSRSARGSRRQTDSPTSTSRSIRCRATSRCRWATSPPSRARGSGAPRPRPPTNPECGSGRCARARVIPGMRVEPWGGSIVGSAERCRALAAEVPGLRFLIDTGHVAGWGEDPCALLDLADHVQLRQASPGHVQVHADDASGAVDFAAVFARLEALGYEGRLSVEYFDLPAMGWPLADPRAWANDLARRVRALLY